METVDARSWLRRLRAMNERIASLRHKVIELRSIAENITPSYEIREGGSSTKNTSSKVEDGAIAIMAAQERLGALAQEYSLMLVEFTTITANMPDTLEAMVLQLRYMDGKSWSTIARKMTYSYDGVMKLHRRAVKNFEKIATGQ